MAGLTHSGELDGHLEHKGSGKKLVTQKHSTLTTEIHKTATKKKSVTNIFDVVSVRPREIRSGGRVLAVKISCT
jgi:hypothetical protein